MFPQTKIETSKFCCFSSYPRDIADCHDIVIVLAFPTWKRILPGPSNTSQSRFPEVLDSYGFSLTSSAGLSKPSSSAYIPDDDSGEKPQRRGGWTEGQWNRIWPIFRDLTYRPSPLSPLAWTPTPGPGVLRERALLWMYSRLNANYYLACQNEGRCWRDLRAILDQGSIKNRTSQ